MHPTSNFLAPPVRTCVVPVGRERGRVFVCSIPNLLFDFQKSLCSGSFVSFEPNLLFDFQNGARPVEGGVGRAEVLSFVFVIFQDLYIQNITRHPPGCPPQACWMRRPQLPYPPFRQKLKKGADGFPSARLFHRPG